MADILTTKYLILSPPGPEDLSALESFEDRNRHHLAKWESAHSANDEPLKGSTQKRLENWINECEDGKSTRFLIRLKENPAKIIGFCNFTQIFRGAFQACYLGYKIDHEYEGKGLMHEALKASIQYAFEKLALHRIMANYMPINMRSAKLLHRLGFTIEGYAKGYLMINGKWEDHVLTAISAEEWFAINHQIY